MLDALALERGIKFVGENAHKELINHISKEKFSEEKRLFLQEMRKKRNRVQYEGLEIAKQYIMNKRNIILEIINELK